MKIIIAAALLAGLSSPSLAATTIVGNTSGGPTYNRPVNSTETSSIGTAVRFQVTEFVVDTDGLYTLTLLSQTPLYDTFLAVYDGTFLPSAPLAGLIALNDDTGDIFRSEIDLIIAAGQPLQAVVSGFDNFDFGAYSLTFDGPGEVFAETVTPVPEPATWGLMLVGFGMLGASMRYRRRKAVVSYG